jgi:hypothetical protein
MCERERLWYVSQTRASDDAHYSQLAFLKFRPFSVFLASFAARTLERMLLRLSVCECALDHTSTGKCKSRCEYQGDHYIRGQLKSVPNLTKSTGGIMLCLTILFHHWGDAVAQNDPNPIDTEN